jgi:pimeloyl-ACP methyl ester carboxylesterase
LGTLLFNLLTDREAAVRRNSFDIPLLADRLVAATRWSRAELEEFPIGWFGASTGAAAALVAAALEPDLAGAIVSRGGRPDLAGVALPRVTAPTLLIVGSEDAEVLDLNREACLLLQCPKALQVVQGAGHLFEEGNTLDQAAEYARHWFVRHLAGMGQHWRR